MSVGTESLTTAWTGSNYIDTIDPNPAHFNIWEVATGLSRENRYGGAATCVFWSVGQHCLLQDHLMVEDGIDDEETLRAGLMHDAPEYMLRDMIKPAKRSLPDYCAMEDLWWSRMCMRWPLPLVLPPAVKHYDTYTLAVEKANLINKKSGTWPGIPVVEDVKIPDRILHATMHEIFITFMVRAKELGID